MTKMRGTTFEIKFADANAVTTARAVPADVVQILRTGKFTHPSYGELEITLSFLESLKKNFEAKVRKIDCSIDYSHESEKEAAGWMQELYLAEDANAPGHMGLFAKTRWTPKGSTVLSDREYRYLSADFVGNYIDPETLQEYGPTLLGAGLTNRPFIKGMEPVIQLSEGVPMDLAALVALVKQLQQQVQAMQQQMQPAQQPGAAGGAASPNLGEQKMMTPEMQKKFDEMSNSLKLAEEKLKTLETEKAAKEKSDAEAKQLSEKTSKFDEMLKGGKVVEAQREAFIKGDMIKFSELAQPVNTERKSVDAEGKETSADSEGTAEEQITKLAEKLVKEKKADSIGDAISIVLADPEHKKLRDGYEKQFNA